MRPVNTEFVRTVELTFVLLDVLLINKNYNEEYCRGITIRYTPVQLVIDGIEHPLLCVCGFVYVWIQKLKARLNKYVIT